ncbi:SRPBCC family protein [Amycolatopsis roodepoortensis]|uniref:SRPBCC family protein n=1 Tax=Amycolatopsis roodepoortensis TaxID=700274 RepID=UPI00214AEDDE|nr:SRPBCC family protein [Amycolatopsis roodepoortensis]UUV31012.1 SRPBCC family protein [Amycolatopsis roodepoortensis]
MTLRRTAALALPLALGLLGGAVTPAQAATTSPAPLSCQGKTIDTKAPIHYRTETLINAPLSKIWRLQTDVERWPSWQEPVLSNERLDRGPLRKNSRFRWTTPAPPTATTPVHQIQRGECLRWSGPAVGEGLSIDNGVHVWTFTEVKGGVLVRTEENWAGAQVEADVPTATKFLGWGLEAWLKDLKTTAESHC